MTEMLHVFERAGLGKAPFRFVGWYEDRGPHRHVNPNGTETLVGAPGQPMGVCDYCGQGIAICCQIVSSDGREFIVGSDCVAKTGDAGLKKVVAKIVRERQTAQRHKREADKIAELKTLLEDGSVRDKLKALPHPRDWAAAKGMTMLDSVEWMMANAGNSGKLTTLRQVKRIIEG